MQPSLNSSSHRAAGSSLLSVDQVTSPVCLPVTPALSAAALQLPHPTQVGPSRAAAACHTAGTPDNMADVVTVVCQHPAQRKQRRRKRRARQKRNDKDSQEQFYTCQHQSISQHDVKNKPKKLRMRPLGGGAAAPYRPPLATRLKQQKSKKRSKKRKLDRFLVSFRLENKNN